ncbi:MAG: porin [Bacteroidia bacterium]|nr:porin [Bacteroidia bacterium]
MAQTDSSLKSRPELTFEAYGDLFWSFDSDRPSSGRKKEFFYNYNQHATAMLNLGYAKMAVKHNRYRANLALHTGSYVEENYEDEHSILRYFNEANVGFALNKKSNLWIDAGIFSSFIGFESAISIENPNLSRSIVAENSPYYLTGLKLGYKPNSKWEASASILTGWQQIQFLEGNTLPSLGSQVKYKVTPDLLLNWSTFIGTHTPDSARKMRYYNNFFVQWQKNPKFMLVAGFDIGLEQKFMNSSNYNHWVSPLLIGQYILNYKWKTGLRVERYRDLNNVIISRINNQNFDVNSYSINADYMAHKNMFFRVEWRYFDSKNAIFNEQGNWKNTNWFAMASLIYKIQKTKSL